MTGSMTIATPVEVLKQVHVTGLTGNQENWIDLSEQVVYLNDSAEIQGNINESLQIFNSDIHTNNLSPTLIVKWAGNLASSR